MHAAVPSEHAHVCALFCMLRRNAGERGAPFVADSRIGLLVPCTDNIHARAAWKQQQQQLRAQPSERSHLFSWNTTVEPAAD